MNNLWPNYISDGKTRTIKNETINGVELRREESIKEGDNDEVELRSYQISDYGFAFGTCTKSDKENSKGISFSGYKAVNKDVNYKFYDNNGKEISEAEFY